MSFFLGGGGGYMEIFPLEAKGVPYTSDVLRPHVSEKLADRMKGGMVISAVISATALQDIHGVCFRRVYLVHAHSQDVLLF